MDGLILEFVGSFVRCSSSGCVSALSFSIKASKASASLFLLQFLNSVISLRYADILRGLVCNSAIMLTKLIMFYQSEIIRILLGKSANQMQIYRYL